MLRNHLSLEMMLWHGKVAHVSKPDILKSHKMSKPQAKVRVLPYKVQGQ